MYTAAALVYPDALATSITLPMEILLSDNLHIDMRYRRGSDHPVGGDDLGQVLPLDVEVDRVAIALCREASVPGHGIDIKVLFLHATDQRVIENVLLATLGRFQLHHCGQCRKCPITLACWQRILNQAIEGVMTRGAASAVDTAKPNNHR